MTSDQIRLLALDGGGVRGLSSLIILRQLMFTINPSCPPTPYEFFDMIGGTSTGGIIAIMLGRLKMTIDQCIEAYSSLSDQVFEKKGHRVTIRGQIQGRFDAAALEMAVKGILLDLGLDPNTLLKDSPDTSCRVFVCATSKQTGDTVCLTNYQSCRGDTDLLNSTRIWEACRATSAATSFFDSIAIGPFGEEFVDGAMGTNNPVYILWNQAQDIWRSQLQERPMCLVSIGTGVLNSRPVQDDAWGIWATLKRMTTETERTAEQFQRDKSTLDNEGRYYRFNVDRGLENIGLAESKKKSEIVAATRRYISSQAVFKQMEACAGNLAGSNWGSSRSPNLEMQEKKEIRRTHLWQSLKFDQIDARRKEIKRAHAETCHWLLRYPGYVDWIDIRRKNLHEGVFWIKGKPGAGKSTLMGFALSRAVALQKNEIITSFFFHARGIDLQKTTIGMYRSLLYHILEILPRPWFCFDLAGLVKSDTIQSVDWSTPQWTVENLQELFEYAVLEVRKQPIFCFIDALDECEEIQIRDMIAFFEGLTESAAAFSIQLRICLASRHYPNISMNRGLELVLDGQQGHRQDITTYINDRLMIGDSKQANVVREELREKANGVFMWVVLVVNILNKEYDSGRIHELRKRLMDIPGDLHQLFRDIMMRDTLHLNEVLVCIKWVLFARRPLTPDELYYAILSDTGADAIQDLSSGDLEVTAKDISRFILDCSKGLVEIVFSPAPTVQFIHESVRDFLLIGDGLTELWPNLRNGFRGLGHDLLKSCCAAYLSTVFDLVGQFLLSHSSVSLQRMRRMVKQRFPFIEYATHYMLQHADLAQAELVSQHKFMKNFEKGKWITLTNFLGIKGKIYTLGVSLLYIFAANDLPSLIQAESSHLSYLDLENESFGTPLHASTVTGSTRALHKFMELEVMQQPDVAMLRELLSDSPMSCNRKLPFECGPKAIDRLIDFADGTLLLFLLAAGKDLHPLCDTWCSGIIRRILSKGRNFAMKLLRTGVKLNREEAAAFITEACLGGWKEVIEKVLATYDVDIYYVNARGLTPIPAALLSHHVVIAERLLEVCEVDVDLQSCGEETLLCHASRLGYVRFIRIFLHKTRIHSNDSTPNKRIHTIPTGRNDKTDSIDFLFYTRKVEINIKNRRGRSPLSYAASKGHVNIVELLLRQDGIEVESRDAMNRTPLSYAAQKGHTEVVLLLLKREDTKVESKDMNDRTPLSYAAEEGHELIVAALLAHESIKVDTCSKTGWTPLIYAASNGHEKVAKLLLQHGGANVNWQDTSGCTALFIAARQGHLPSLEILLEETNINANVKNRQGFSTLSIARTMGHDTIIQKLLGSGKVIN